MSGVVRELIRHEGLFYQSFISHLCRSLPASNYLEIGTRAGDTLALVDCPSIAVDPNFVMSRDVMGVKPACHFFQTTSDAFFGEVDPTKLLGAPIDLAFLDGMHLFEFLLRDFINTERHCAPESVILLHDCFPPTYEMATRAIIGEAGNERGARGHPDYLGYWTGDVWKVAAILRELRPDLRLIRVNAPPTGLLICTNLDPSSTVLSDRYSEIVERWAPSEADEQRLSEYLRAEDLTDTGALMSPPDLAARLGRRIGGTRQALPGAFDLLRPLIERSRPRRIAWIAHEVPDWLLNQPAPLLIVSLKPPLNQRPDDIWVQHYPTVIDEAIASEISRRLDGREEELELAFLDGDHGLPALRSQLLFLTEANPKIVVAFACAVPPRLEIAGPHQIEGQWWVGEVWAMIAWLKRAQASLLSVVVDSDPVGFGVLRNISHKVLSDNSVEGVRGELANLRSLAEVRAALGVVEPGRLNDECERWLIAEDAAPSLRLASLDAVERSAGVEVEVLASSRPFVRPPAVIFADLSRRGIGHELGSPKSMRTPRKVWIGMPDARIRGYFLVELSGGRLFLPRIAGAEGERAFVDHVRSADGPRRAGRAFHSGLRWLADGHMAIDDGRHVELDGDVFWATPDEPENWGVWLLQTLPALIHADRIGFDGSVLAYLAGNWQVALIERFAPRLMRKLIAQDFSRTYGVRGKTWMLAQEDRTFALSDFDREIYDSIADEAKRRVEPRAGDEKLYVSRQSRSRKNPFYRALLNEAELAEALVDEGFREIEPETLSIDEQIALFARARFIVGAGGAGLFNAVFCRPGASIFTLESSNRWIEAHANLFASRGLNYSVAFGRELERDEPPHRRWTIAVDDALSEIRRASRL